MDWRTLSAFWLWCYKAFKWVCRQLLGTPSELESLCRCAAGIHDDAWWLRLIRRLLRRRAPKDASEEPLLAAEPDAWERALSYVTVYRIDRALLFSSTLTLPRRQLEAWDNDDLVEVWKAILDAKNFRRAPDGDVLTPASCVLYRALVRIRTTFRLLHDLNARAAAKFDTSNKMHERRLLDLWQLAMDANQKLPDRLGAHWQQLGFQGSDPATDFRGMGLLGLDQLIYFCKKYPALAQKSLTASRHPQHWYTWACVGISITNWIVMLMRSRKLQLYLYSALQQHQDQSALDDKERFQRLVSSAATEHASSQRLDAASRALSPTMQDPVLAYMRECVHKLYCYSFDRFNRDWEACVVKLPPSQPAILQFPKIFGDFQRRMEEQLLLAGSRRNAITVEYIHQSLHARQQ